MKKYILCSVIALGSLSCTDSFLEEKMNRGGQSV